MEPEIKKEVYDPETNNTYDVIKTEEAISSRENPNGEDKCRLLDKFSKEFSEVAFERDPVGFLVSLFFSLSKKIQVAVVKCQVEGFDNQEMKNIIDFIENINRDRLLGDFKSTENSDIQDENGLTSDKEEKDCEEYIEDQDYPKYSDYTDYDQDYPDESKEDESYAPKQRPRPVTKKKSSKKVEIECKVCSRTFLGIVAEYKHYVKLHPSFPNKPPKPTYLINKEMGGKVTKKYKKEDVIVSCKLCKKSFARVPCLYNHCKKEHPDNPEILPEEPVRLGPLRTLHNREMINGQFMCGSNDCNLMFDRFLSLVDHERTHKEDFLCILCGLPTFSAETLISHMDSHHQDKAKFVCRVCGFFNRNSRNQHTHMLQEHMKGALVYRCEKCDFVTENKVTFGSHKRMAHSAVTFVCEQCGKEFTSQQGLYQHRKLHQPNVKKFACEYCPQKFTHSSILMIHMRVHTGEKPYHCEICGSRFGSHTAIKTHKKTVHVEEKDMVFQCDVCGKKFPERAERYYRDHCKTHTGERDHVCEVCGSSYFSRRNLRKHERAAHPHLKPMKPKPFKIDTPAIPNPEIRQNGTERLAWDLTQQTAILMSTNNLLLDQANKF